MAVLNMIYYSDLSLVLVVHQTKVYSSIDRKRDFWIGHKIIVMVAMSLVKKFSLYRLIIVKILKKAVKLN